MIVFSRPRAHAAAWGRGQLLVRALGVFHAPIVMAKALRLAFLNPTASISGDSPSSHRGRSWDGCPWRPRSHAAAWAVGNC